MKLFLRSLRILTNTFYKINNIIEIPLILLFYIVLYKKLIRFSLSKFVLNSINYPKKIKSLNFIFSNINVKYFKKYKRKRRKIILMLIMYFLLFIIPFDKLSLFTLTQKYALLQISIFFLSLQFFSIVLNNLTRNIKYLIKNKIKTNFKININQIKSNMLTILFHFLICSIIYSYTFICLIFKTPPLIMSYFLLKIPLKLLQIFKKNTHLNKLLFIKKHL